MTASTTSSRQWRATTWTPIGNPALEKPQGIASAGQPSTLKGRVSRVAAERTSSVTEPKATVISPILGAVIGVAGVIRQSRCVQIFEKSRASTRRTRWAFR